MNRSLLAFAAILVMSAGCAAPEQRADRTPAPLAVSIVPAQSVSLASSFEAGGVVRARSTATCTSAPGITCGAGLRSSRWTLVR